MCKEIAIDTDIKGLCTRPFARPLAGEKPSTIEDLYISFKKPTYLTMTFTKEWKCIINSSSITNLKKISLPKIIEATTSHHGA